MDREAGRVGGVGRGPLALLILLLAGCTSLRSNVPLEQVSPRADPHTRYQVWSGGTPHVLIALRVTTDTVSGVPYWKPPECDSCRLSIPRAAVDSVRGSGFDPNKSLVAILLITPVILFSLLFSEGGGGS